MLKWIILAPVLYIVAMGALYVYSATIIIVGCYLGDFFVHLLFHAQGDASAAAVTSVSADLVRAAAFIAVLYGMMGLAIKIVSFLFDRNKDVH